MNNGSVLYIHLIAHAYAVYVTSQYSIEPNAAIIAHDHVPNNCGIWCDETIFSKRWVYIIYREYNRHVVKVQGTRDKAQGRFKVQETRRKEDSR